MVDPVKRSFSLSLLACSVFGAILLVGCQVEANANVKASGSGGEGSASVDESSSTTSAPAATDTAGATPPPSQPPSTPPEGCPLSCFEAQGPTRVMVTEAEQTQLRSALEPVLGKMRACSSPEEWRRRGSPTINIRVAPDGTLADMGVDAQHDRDTTCMNSAAYGANPTVSLPGRKTVRCVERCGGGGSGERRPAAPRKTKR